MKQNNPRPAKLGEVELYKFLRAHQGEFNFKESTEFTVDWDRLIKGDVKELNDLKESPFATPVMVRLWRRVAEVVYSSRGKRATAE